MGQINSSVLRSTQFHLAFFKRDESTNTLSIVSAKWNEPRDWLRVPLVWAVIGAQQLILVTWATHYTETAIVSTIYELWPAFVVFGLIGHDNTIAEYKEGHLSSRARRETAKMSVAHKALILIAVPVGLTLLMLAQGENNTHIGGLFEFNKLAGMVLALIAASWCGLLVVGTLSYSSLAYYQLASNEHSSSENSIKDL